MASLDQPAPSLLYTVKQLEMAVRARLDEVLRPHRVTVTQYTAMTVLATSTRPLTSSDLARRAFVRAQSMAEMVATLEERGLLTRRRPPDDRKRLILELTPAGRELLDACAPDVAALEREVFHGMDEKAREELTGWLQQARRNVRPR